MGPTMALATTSIGGDRHGPLQPSWHRGARGHHGPLGGPRGREPHRAGGRAGQVHRLEGDREERVGRVDVAQARLQGLHRAGAGGREEARLQAPRALDDTARRSLVASLIRDRHWSPEQVAGRMRAEAPSEAVSASTIRRAVGSGALDCELPGWQSMRRRRARTEDIDEGMAGGGSNTLAFICS